MYLQFWNKCYPRRSGTFEALLIRFPWRRLQAWFWFSLSFGDILYTCKQTGVFSLFVNRFFDKIVIKFVKYRRRKIWYLTYIFRCKGYRTRAATYYRIWKTTTMISRLFHFECEVFYQTGSRGVINRLRADYIHFSLYEL